MRKLTTMVFWRWLAEPTARPTTWQSRSQAELLSMCRAHLKRLNEASLT